MSSLFQSLQLGPLTLPNRIVMAPLTRMRNFVGRAPSDLQATHYAQRASAGLILTEATSVGPMAVGYPDTPGIWTDEQVAAWTRVVSAVHAKGGRMCMQLWHVGRISDPEMLGGERPVAPSALAPSGDVKVLRPKRPYTVPRPLETAEIAGVVQDFARAAANARAAGFDLVEVHAANGYLFDQFMHDGSNRRTDQYGGPVENRARLLMEVLDAMAQVWPAERIGVHLNLMSSSHDMRDSDPLALFSHVARQLQDRRIGFLFAREALVKADHQSWDQAVLPIGRHVRQIYTGCYIANEGFTQETGEMVLAKGWADAVSYGRAYMANPDLPERFAKGAPLNELNPRTVYSTDATGYNDYPLMSD